MNKKVKSAIGWILYLALLAGLILGVPRGLAYFLETDYPMANYFGFNVAGFKERRLGFDKGNRK